ncbi:YwqG family protein [Melghirimyces algeriensis]|uniref:Uncharacterized protein YwqG n=1 Tax=Melghirimyces algeriensis TaxID=910412 RepID=A0A521D3B9_9BACL|nr:YwqG family protein [Melghirimyces algeriensis]SMO66157.1 Uncharacterized protein YwqG [Melghirimyces algeriensis]
MAKTMEDKIKQMLKEQGLSEMEEEVIRTLVPCLILHTEEQGAVPVGTSKFGGTPDLPSDWGYPLTMGKPLPFIAQYNLSELGKADAMHPLPDRGMLYFFAAVDDLLWGASSDQIHCEILYADVQPEALVPTPFPEDLPREVRFPERQIHFRLEQSLPNVENPSDMEEIWFDLMDQLYELEERDDGYHQAFGEPLSLTEDIFDICRRHTGKKSDEWVLLLQMDTEADDEEAEWGDLGMLYFCITQEDLLKGNFHEACLVVQK